MTTKPPNTPVAPTRRLLYLVLLVLMLLAPTCLFVYLGGHWENWPLLQHISGRQRFRQFVANPIPETIYAVRGGYTGFPQGAVVTRFQSRETIDPQQFSPDWSVLEPSQQPSVAPIFASEMPAADVYQYRDEPRYLVIDATRQKGVLYIPGKDVPLESATP